MAEEDFLPFATPRAQIPLATQFRSTWLTSSLRALRERNLLDAYLAELPKRYHDAVLSSVVGVWLPTEVAVAHYQACDRMHLPESVEIEIGADVARRVHGGALGTAARLGRGAGLTPWTVFGQLGRLWERVWLGGAVGVFRLGPKEARVELVQWPCARVPYCRVALRGVLIGLTELFCRRAFVHEIPALCTDASLAYRVQWV
jgi:hypothetical protein